MDTEICHCYHVTLRKLVNFARRTRPKHASQMSECLGAGTGCGGCAPELHAILELADKSNDEIIAELVARRHGE